MIVKNNKERVITIGVNLIPGVNTLTGKDEERFMKQVESAERFAELGIIEFLDKDTRQFTQSILDLNVKEALVLIKETLDIPELRGMIIREAKDKNRSTVITAIKEQLSMIDKTTTKK